MDIKKCTKCGEEKPATAEYFHRDARKTLGLTSQCKSCRNKYYEENREKISAYGKKYYEENREQKKVYHKKYMRQRSQQDPIFRLLHNMRGGVYKVLSGKRKNSRTMQYVNMTPDELMDYLEGRFTEGMTRDNYGKWHVDHIRPISSFDFTGPDNEEQLHMAWNYTNLQPLWAADNISKGAKYEEG